MSTQLSDAERKALLEYYGEYAVENIVQLIESAPEEPVATAIAKRNAFETHLHGGRLEVPEIIHHNTDTRVATVRQAVETEENLVIDLSTVAGLMGERFAVAPVRYAGRRLWRSRDTGDGEMLFRVYHTHRRRHWVRWSSVFNRPFALRPWAWSMHFEPGVVTGHSQGHSEWKHAWVPIPTIPAELVPENPKNCLIVWETAYTEKMMRPLDPAIIEHIEGDVYVVRAVWDLTPLEAAALRGRR